MLRPGKRLAVNAHLVIRADAPAGMRLHLAVDGDAPGEDQLVRLASGAASGLSDHLVQTALRKGRLFLRRHGRCGRTTGRTPPGQDLLAPGLPPGRRKRGGDLFTTCGTIALLFRSRAGEGGDAFCARRHGSRLFGLLLAQVGLLTRPAGLPLPLARSLGQRVRSAASPCLLPICEFIHIFMRIFLVCLKGMSIRMRHIRSGRPLLSALLLTKVLLLPCRPGVLTPFRHMALPLIAVGRNSGRRLTAPRAARGTKWGGTRQQGRIFRTRSGRRRRVSRGSQGTRRPAAYRTTQQTRSHTYIPLISKQSWLQRIDQSQPRYLLCPTCRGRSRKRRIGGNGKNSYHIEIKQFLMSKVYIIIIMRQKE